MKNLKDVKKYIKQIRPIFLCEEFDLDIKNEQSKDNTYATMGVRYDYLDATLSIYPYFYNQDEALQKKILVHEMCHFITLLQDKVVDDLMEGKLITMKHATEVLERANSWMERILCTSLKKELSL